MRGHFSIEWMAQSSQPAGTETLAACGTTAESLPGFYCRQRAESGAEEQQRLSGSSLNSPQHQTSSTNSVTEAGFSSGTEEETSGYESEGSRSLSPSEPADCASSSSSSSSSSSCSSSSPAGRRPRTAFTAEQISSLERAFKRNAYLGTQDKAELCKKLNLSDKQIRNWFQNRRMKLKRTVQDALAHACQANVASQFMHYPELQAYRPGPYPRYPHPHPHHHHHHHPAAAAAAMAAAGAGQEAPSATSYVHPHSLQQYASSSLPPLDSFYQYSSLPGVILPPHPSTASSASASASASSNQLTHYPTYPQYY